MTIQTVLEVGVCLNRFKNVDLHNQGYYRISVSLTKGSLASCSVDEFVQKQQKALKKQKSKPRQGFISPHDGRPVEIRATPYSFFEQPPDLSHVNGQVVPDSLGYFEHAMIDDTRDVFYSKTFLVRYVEEERCLNDGVHFRTELDLAEVTEEMSIRVCLERADLDEFNPKEASHAQRDKFEFLGIRTIRLNYATEGVHEYLPIMFDDVGCFGFALVDATIHASITGIRFEPGVPRGLPGERENPASTIRLSDFLYLKFREACLHDGLQFDFVYMDDYSSIAMDDAFIRFVENFRRSYLYALRSSYVELGKCIDLILSKKPASAMTKEVNEKTLELTALEPFTVKPKLVQVDDDDNGKSIILDQVAHEMAVEMDHFSSTLLLAWHAFLQRLRDGPSQVMFELKQDWLKRATERAGESILRENCAASDIGRATIAEKWKERMNIASKIRESAKHIRQFQKEKVEDHEVFDDISSYPIVFEQIYLSKEKQKEQQHEEEMQVGEKHFVVLIHGFLGSSWDLRPFRNYLTMVEPNVVPLLSCANENDTDSDIGVLGFRLAREIDDFISNYLGTKRNIKMGKLSFVCHSIGSVILRSALSHPCMDRYVPHFHTFVSLSSPHLGSKVMSSTIVKYGLWAMRHLRKATALSQLTMTDHQDVRETFMFRLSQKARGLRSFKHVVLISSQQDNYVPYHSARVEPLSGGPEAVGIMSEDIAIADEMAANILRGIPPEALMRLDLCFKFDNTKTRRMDKLIGRAAHIKILDSPALSLILLLNYHRLLFPG